MGETRDNDAYEEELLDYEEEEEKAPDSVASKVNGEAAKKWVVSSLTLILYIYLSCSICLVRFAIMGKY